MDEVLDDEQRRRPVIELLALVHADVDAHPAAVGANAVGLRQFVVLGHARQVLRQAPAAVRLAAPLRLRRRRGRGGRGRGRPLAWTLGQLAEEQRLVGIEAFPARPVQAA